MSREQIEEMAKDLCNSAMCNLETYDSCRMPKGNCGRCQKVAEDLYNAGYRKQSEGEWIKDEKSKFEHRYYCSVCNFYLIGAPTKHCEDCGAHMKGANDEN